MNYKANKIDTVKTTLLIMAAGIGSRFGTGIKQLEPVDDANHIIMDYSIYDAIEAGFNHVVFFANTFWTKLQNIFGHYCKSKLDKVAKPRLAAILPAA